MTGQRLLWAGKAVTLALLASIIMSGHSVASRSSDIAVVAGATQHLSFGTLSSRPAHSDMEAAAGIRDAMVELSWGKFEPLKGRYDTRYIAMMRAQIEALRNSGRTLTLGLGLEDAPSWLLALPASRFVNQQGQASTEANLVFDQRLRDLAQGYISKVAVEIGFGGFAFVRLNSGAGSEMMYPDTGDYWAFDSHALSGLGLPPGMARNPAPDWRPVNGPLDADAASGWANWYVGGLANLVRWQIGVLSNLRFRGIYQVLTPGVGVRPSELAAVLRQSGRPNDLLGAGAVWAMLYSQLPRRADIMAYITSTADSSGGDDSCEATDRLIPLTSVTVEDWSAARWISRVAAENGFDKGGENPGWAVQGNLNSFYRDPSDTGMMAAAVRQARACGYRALYWAHDDQLWDGTASFDEFAQFARSYNG